MSAACPSQSTRRRGPAAGRPEEAVDAEAGAERAGRRQATEGGEPGDEVGEDAVGEEERDEDPLEERVGEQPRDPVAPLAHGRGVVGAARRRHGLGPREMDGMTQDEEKPPYQTTFPLTGGSGG